VPDPVESSLTPFAWVYKRDGRLVPFEADKISRSLFAAGDRLGQPNAFLARELTDSVLHFLSAEAAAGTPTTAQIAEVVVKVTRELGQPALARGYTEARAMKKAPPPATVPAEPGVQSPRAHDTLDGVFTRDILAAHADGLLTLPGLHAPLQLAGMVLPLRTISARGLRDAISETSRLASMVVVDHPEYLLTGDETSSSDLSGLANNLVWAAQEIGVPAVVNLNSASPPAAMGDLAAGPLFEGRRPGADPTRMREAAAFLLNRLLQPGAHSIGIYWHVGERDFSPDAATTLVDLAHHAVEGAPLTFVFDRGQPIHLAGGVDRAHPAALLLVGLNLPWLVTQMQPSRDVDVFMQKLGSLARLALSAAAQKREFLRHHSEGRPALTGGFLLERARLVVTPIGLDAATRTLVGGGLCSSSFASDFGRRVVQRLADVLRVDGQAYLLESCVDSAPSFAALGARDPAQYQQTAPEFVPGLTPWDATIAVRSQLHAAGPLHAAAGAGTAALLMANEAITTEQLTDTLHYAWKHTAVACLRLIASGA
jgi:ATP cone domain